MRTERILPLQLADRDFVVVSDACRQSRPCTPDDVAHTEVAPRFLGSNPAGRGLPLNPRPGVGGVAARASTATRSPALARPPRSTLRGSSHRGDTPETVRETAPAARPSHPSSGGEGGQEGGQNRSAGLPRSP